MEQIFICPDFLSFVCSMLIDIISEQKVLLGGREPWPSGDGRILTIERL